MAFELFVNYPADCWITRNRTLYFAAHLRKRPPWKDAVAVEFYYEPDLNVYALRPIQYESPHAIRIRQSRSMIYVPFSPIINQFPQVFRVGARFRLQLLGIEVEPLYQLVPAEPAIERRSVLVKEGSHA